MIIVMHPEATPFETDDVVAAVEGKGWQTHISCDSGQTIIGLQGRGQPIDAFHVGQMAGVYDVVAITQKFKLASRTFRPQDTTFRIPLRPKGGSLSNLGKLDDDSQVLVGDRALVIIAGPCSVESRSQLLEAAHAVKEAGATMLRGGAFKPRTSPYSFQGLGEEGLSLLAEAREATGLPIVTEVTSPRKIALVSIYADVLQIGARNMQNFDLLNAVGQTHKPVLLKRGMSATAEDLLMAAEYLLATGNSRILLCERGIRTFDNKYTRNSFDVSAIPLLKEMTHLPVIADPSHATGVRRHVAPISLAAVAAGADGLMIEVHPHPEEAYSDGDQSLLPSDFSELMAQIRTMAAAVDRTV